MCGSRNFCRGGGGGGGGAAVQARLLENSSDNFFSPQLYRGCPIVISNKTIIFNIFRGEGVQMLISIETHITYDFPGGGGESGPPTPLLIRTWGDCGCAGGGGVQARLPENSSDNFFSPQLYRGCPIVISNKTIIFNIFRGEGVQMLISIETHITYDFPGGGGESGPPTPLLIRTWGDCACAGGGGGPGPTARKQL